MTFLYLYLFSIGVVLGSFFNVVGMRIPIGKSIIKPRSACPNCGHVLQIGELIPIISFMLQSGKCKKCGEKISILYPIIEFLTGCLFVLSFYRFGVNFEFIIAITIISLLMIVIASDLSYMLIPNRILLFFFPIIIVERFINPLIPLKSSLVGAICAFLFLFFVAVISKGGMGGGDVKLMGLLGYVLGLKLIILTFVIACFSGTIIGLAIIRSGKTKQQRNPIPFGPFIALGGLISYFYGNEIISWYLLIRG